MKYIPAIALFAVLIKGILTPIDWPLALALVACSISFVYMHAVEIKTGVDFKETIKGIEAGLKKHQDDIDFYNARITELEDASAEVLKIAEDTKKVVSSANLGMAFRAPNRTRGANNIT